MNALLSLVEPEFMREALMTAGLIAVPAALLSCFVVLRGWALMADAISHAVLPGILLAFALGLPLLVGAFLAAISCTLTSNFVSHQTRIKPDTALGLVFAGFLALGLLLFSLLEPPLRLERLLFGSLLGIEPSELVIGLFLSLLIIAWLLVQRRALLLQAFDPAQARALGLPSRLLETSLLLAMAALVVSALSLVGLILTLGLLIAPGATAFLVTHRFVHMQILAVVLALVASMGGVLLSLVWDSAPGPTIMLLLTLAFLLALVWRLVSDQLLATQSRSPTAKP